MDWSRINRLLVFGGSFDPPHRGHVELPRWVRAQLGCDAVAYVPAGRAPHKLDQVQTDPADRLAMTRLAVADDPASVVLDLEVRREPGAPSYTVDTLRELAGLLRPGATMRLLIGTDQMVIFDSWKEAGLVQRLAEPVVMLRPPETVDSALGRVPAAERPAWRRRLLAVAAPDLSSTEIRRRVARGASIAGMVPPAVEAYIGEHGLYRVRSSA